MTNHFSGDHFRLDWGDNHAGAFFVFDQLRRPSSVEPRSLVLTVLRNCRRRNNLYLFMIHACKAFLTTRGSSKPFHCSNSAKHRDLHVCSPLQSSKAFRTTLLLVRESVVLLQHSLETIHAGLQRLELETNKVSTQISHDQCRKSRLLLEHNIPSVHS
jgi:hypothetical protein